MHRTRTTVFVAAVLLAPSVYALDMPETKVSMETCMKAALAAKPGKVKKVELEIEEGKALYEFVIKADGGGTWEIECDAMTGQVTETERDAGPSDPVWKAGAKITAKQAEAAALKAHPGKVKGTEREVHGDNKAVWEVEIMDAGGKEIEVHVDAATGEIISAEHESDEKTVYSIGSK